METATNRHGRFRVSANLSVAVILVSASFMLLAFSSYRYLLSELWDSAARPRPRDPMDSPELHSQYMLSGVQIPLRTIPRTSPIILPTAQVSLTTEDLVIDVIVNGVHRGYPVRFLEGKPATHVINDTLEGTPIVVTWCDLALCPRVYARCDGDEVLTFGVSGLHSGQLWLYAPNYPGSWSQETGVSTDPSVPELEPFAFRIIRGADWIRQYATSDLYVGDASDLLD